MPHTHNQSNLAPFQLVSSTILYLYINSYARDRFRLAEGKITRCPNAADIQSDYVKNHFNMTKFEGVYYELAYHDYTQPNVRAPTKLSTE